MILPSPACICQASSSWDLFPLCLDLRPSRRLARLPVGVTEITRKKVRPGAGKHFRRNGRSLCCQQGPRHVVEDSHVQLGRANCRVYTRLVSRVGGGGAATTPTHHHRHPAGRWLGNYRHRIGRGDGKGRSYLISFPPQSLLILLPCWWCYLITRAGTAWWPMSLLASGLPRCQEKGAAAGEVSGPWLPWPGTREGCGAIKRPRRRACPMDRSGDYIESLARCDPP